VSYGETDCDVRCLHVNVIVRVNCRSADGPFHVGVAKCCVPSNGHQTTAHLDRRSSQE
jgi:hypothetical protein